MINDYSINGEIKIIIDKLAKVSIKLYKIISSIPSGTNETIIDGLNKSAPSNNNDEKLTRSVRTFSEENNRALNPSGDFISNTDIIAQEEIINAISQLPQVAAIISEEEENPILLNEKKGKYILTIDPLDGSSNIENKGPTGTIFSLYNRISNENESLKDEDFLQKGSQQIIAGYAFYGPSLSFVFASNDNTRIFQYDFSNKNFIKTHDKYMLSNETKYYSINEAYENIYEEKVINILKKLKEKNLSSRYSGALVADIHRILISGGVFLYPKTKLRPEGKIRLMFESNPIAFIIKASGGFAIDGKQNILDIDPKAIHQKTPIFIGSKDLKSLFI